MNRVKIFLLRFVYLHNKDMSYQNNMPENWSEKEVKHYEDNHYYL